jgi:lipopolysaccharide export system protein LptA
VYLRDSSRVEARGNVHGFDDKNQVALDAQAIDYDRGRHLAVATQQPVMRATDHNGRTVEMRAVQLRLNTETRVAEAIDSVRVARDTLQASADHALFDDLKDHGWLTGSPRLSDGETNVTGDSIEVLTDQRVIKRVIVRGKAAMDYHGLRAGSPASASTCS